MGIRFEMQDGRIGTLDVTQLISSEIQGGKVIGVKNGLVQVKRPDGGTSAFSLGQWAEQHQANIVQMDGFNSPDTALDQPPNGLNYMDQSVFFHDGMDISALQDMYPGARKLDDGRVVVLDNDGLWKTMWSPFLLAPEPPSSFKDQVDNNQVNDPRLTMRTAGITFFFGLAGMEAQTDNNGNFKITEVVKALKVIGRNAPMENKMQIGKLLEQTTGLETFKLTNAVFDPDSVGMWMNRAKKLTSFQFRMNQMEMVELVVDGMKAMAQDDFQSAMKPLQKLEETKTLLINLKQTFGEFIQFLVGLDLLRDISKTTGLNEWVALSSDQAYDPSKLPPMPKFVEKFVTLLRWIMPIVQENTLSFAKGKNGLKAVTGLLVMIDDCIYSLAGVPDTGAKYKMFMALRRVQSQLETKLSFHYQPDPLKNTQGLKENPFMQAKARYSDKREAVYEICQTPKESWNNTLLDTLKNSPSLEQFYDNLPPRYVRLLKAFAAMDAAYDMQPWVDVNHAQRTHDPFSEFNESFGLPPPEAGYLAKNSPRAVFNIAETLVEGAAFLTQVPEAQTMELLRNPFLLSNLLRTLMTASVNRELGTVEVLSKFGIMGGQDTYASPDANRIWEDPEMVDKDNQRQIEEMMGQMAMEQSMQQQGQQQQGAQEQGAQEQQRDAGQAPVAGPGPSGQPMQAQPARRAG